MRRSLALVGGVLVGLALAAPSGAATVKVNCATQNLQAKIDAAPAGSTLRIKGTCVGQFIVPKDLTLDGDPHATIDGARLGRPLTLTGVFTRHLLDLTVTGGHELNGVGGGGILSTGGTLTLRRVTVTGNELVATGPAGGSANGGGILSIGALQIRDSVVRGNRATASMPGPAVAVGGGIYVNGNTTITGSTVAGNVAEASATGSAGAIGGGIYLASGAFTLSSSRVTGNRVVAHAIGAGADPSAQAGGIVIGGAGAALIRDARISGNQAVALGNGAGGNAIGGGLVSVTSGGLTLRDSTLDANAARSRNTGVGASVAYAGGLYYVSGPGTILRTKITGSRASAVGNGASDAYAGGFAAVGVATTLRLSKVTGNRAEATSTGGNALARAGGALQSAGSLLADRATVDGNAAVAQGATGTAVGGGLEASMLTLRASTVSRNRASGPTSTGGGLMLLTPAAITNSTIASNRATGTSSSGGGIWTTANVTLTSATVARNAAGTGGGIYRAAGTVTLAGTIVALNTASASKDCFGSIASAGHNLVGSAAGCTFGTVATDKLNRGAKLGTLGAHGGPTQTIPLKKKSPALNAIPKAQCPTTRDQRGVKRPRPKTGRCDIGAYERTS